MHNAANTKIEIGLRNALKYGYVYLSLYYLLLLAAFNLHRSLGMKENLVTDLICTYIRLRQAVVIFYLHPVFTHWGFFISDPELAIVISCILVRMLRAESKHMKTEDCQYTFHIGTAL